MLDRARVLSVIEGVIAPFIGPTVTRVSLDLHCQKLGLSSEQISRQQVGDLLGQLAPAMRVFVGDNRTFELIGKIESELALKETP